MQTLKWQFLADTFTEYQRMCVVHLGLPYWELCFAETCHLPSWAEQLFLLLAPHLLESNETRRNHRNALSPSEPIVYNQLDLLVFRAKTKCHKQTPKYKWNDALILIAVCHFISNTTYTNLCYNTIRLQTTRCRTQFWHRANKNYLHIVCFSFTNKWDSNLKLRSIFRITYASSLR